jgi:hypothetical protein
MTVMKINILTSIDLLCFMLVLTLSTGCNAVSSKKEENKAVLYNETDGQQISGGEEWLKSIFQCDNGNDYCFPDEKKITTTRYYEYFVEWLGIYEYPDFETENEQIAAEKAFKNKWKNIYPLGKEVWAPFGRGNGMEAGDKLENVTITHLSDLKFTALIDYGEENIFFNALLLIPSGDAFLIDYIETTFIELEESEINLPFLQNLSLAKLELGTNPDDAKRLLGKPQSESSQTGLLEVSGFIDEDYIVTTTTLEYDGIQLIYEDDRMIHAYITMPGKSFGWIACNDKNCDKNFLMKKFNLTKKNIYKNEDGEETLHMGDFISLNITFDENDLVKTIEMNTGP